MPGAGSEAENTAEKRCPVCCIPTEDVVKHFRENHPGVEGVVCPHCCKLLSKKCTLNRHIEQVHLGLQIFKVNTGETGSSRLTSTIPLLFSVFLSASMSLRGPRSQ